MTRLAVRPHSYAGARLRREDKSGEFWQVRPASFPTIKLTVQLRPKRQ